jgi:hypothetical protein
MRLLMVSIKKLSYGASDCVSHVGLRGSLAALNFIDTALAHSYNLRIKKSNTYDLHPENRLGLAGSI